MDKAPLIIKAARFELLYTALPKTTKKYFGSEHSCNVGNINGSIYCTGAKTGKNRTHGNALVHTRNAQPQKWRHFFTVKA